jgi:hypothetical protein
MAIFFGTLAEGSGLVLNIFFFLVSFSMILNILPMILFVSIWQMTSPDGLSACIWNSFLVTLSYT